MKKYLFDYITCIGGRELNEDAVCVRQGFGQLYGAVGFF